MRNKYFILLFIITTLYAQNSTVIQKNNSHLNITQKAHQYGNNTIQIGDNNKNITISQKIEVIDNSNKLLSTIKASLSDIKLHKSEIKTAFEKLLRNQNNNTKRKIEKLQQKFALLDTQTNISSKKIQTLEKDIDNIIQHNKNELTKLKTKINHMQNNIAFLMNEFHQGNLTTLSFYGLYIDAFYLNNTFYKGAGAEYERLFNSSQKYNFSLVANFSITNANETNIIEDNNKQFYMFDIGIKKPFITGKREYSIYQEGNIGYLWGDENSLYFKLSIGTEKINKKNKITAELSYMGVLDKETTTIQTHIFGNAEVFRKKEYQHAIALRVMISFASF